MSQSEVSEILGGRRVQSYDVLIRVADGLGIPRGLMGLAYDEDHHEQPAEEADEDVERRKLLALAGAILCGAPVFGEPEPLIVRRAAVAPPRHISISDVSMYEEALLQLLELQRRVGGRASREPLSAMARAGEQLLQAKCAPEMHQRLRYLVSDAHRRAGWASGDIGLVDNYRYHMHQALDFASGDSDRVAQVFLTAGAMEKSLGHSEFSLQLLQMGQVAAQTSRDPQVQAVLAGEIVTGYITFGHMDAARKQLRAARSLFADADITRSLPGFAAYGNGHGVLSSAELKLGNFEGARREILLALQKRPKHDLWCNALDTIILATTHVRAGEVREGIAQTEKALTLVNQVGSERLQDRMKPLAADLARTNDSTAHDLARTIHNRLK